MQNTSRPVNQESLIEDNKRLREALKAYLEVHDDPCWHDHHGLCQAHNCRSNAAGAPECQVALAREVLALSDKIERLDPKKLGVPDLHENSGRYLRTMTWGRLMVGMNFAEEPCKPWWRRCFSERSVNKEGIETTDLWCAITAKTAYWEHNGNHRLKVWRFHLGPIVLYLGVL